MLSHLQQDVRYGVRTLLRSPGFTTVAVLALALGIGANTAIFSVVNAVLLRPLPFLEPGRLVTIWEDYSENSRSIISAPEIAAFDERADLLQGVAPLHQVTFTLRDRDEPEQLLGALTSASLLPILGVTPVHGRGFTAEEDAPGGGQVVVISHELSKRRFGADPSVVGRSVNLDVDVGYGPDRELPATYTIVGVLPPGFEIPFLDDDVELWVPLALDAGLMSDENHYLFAIARLRDGITLERAQGELREVARRLDEERNLHEGRLWRLDLVALNEVVVGSVRPALLVLLGAVGFVLLTACANIANLLLARASARRREFAVRSALGARPKRLVRQLTVESALIALVGGGVGLLLAYWGIEFLSGLAPEDLPRLDEVSLDARVLLFTLLLSMLTALLFGLIPALQAAHPDVREALQEGGRGLKGDRRGGRLRAGLVVAELALALLLLVGAGLLIKSFLRLQDVPLGFDDRNALTAQISLPESSYDKREKVEVFMRQMLTEIQALPGVRSVAVTSALPLSGWNSAMNVLEVEGKEAPGPGEMTTASWRSVSPSYQKTMGIPLLRGRALEDADVQERIHSIVVNRAMAERYWPGEDAVGRRVRLPVGPDSVEAPWLTVVGVVENTRYGGPELAPDAMIYFPALGRRAVDLVVRTAGDPLRLAPTLRRTVQRLDPNLPLANVEPLQHRVDSATAESRFNAVALVVFAGLALLLANIGIYGVMAYAVAQRKHEIGVRIALGARRTDVVRMVLARGLRLVGIGSALGLVGALALSQLLSGLLYGVSARDPATFAGVALVLALVALAASGVPALRASRLDPVVALREE
jgi:putative ABC transport system permease protein